MTVYASKPEINVREKLKELDKPSGVAGEAMLRAETPQEQFNLIGAGRKNLIINGDFRIWQRGTGTFTGQDYNADRWYMYKSGATGEVTKSAHRELTISMTTASDYARLMQAIEKPVIYNEHITVSFKVKGTAPVGGLNVRLFGALGTANASMGYDHNVYVDEINENEYTKIEATFPKANFTGESYDLALCIGQHSSPSTTAWSLSITEVQLELGKVATPFEHRSYGEELALCQRYGVRLGAHPDDPTSNYNLIGSGWWRASTVLYNLQIQAKLPVTLRHKDYTVSVIGTNQFYVQSGGTVGQASFYAINNPGSSPDAVWLDFTATTAAATDGQAAAVGSENNPAYNNAIFIDAEL